VFPLCEVKNKTTIKITVVDGFSTQLLKLFILKKLFKSKPLMVGRARFERATIALKVHYQRIEAT
jgi:hypothetical protein